MIHHVQTYFLHAISDEIDPPTKIFQTVFVPTKPVTATIALSLLTFGSQRIGEERRSGWGGCLIRKASFAGPNGAEPVSLTPNFEHNELFVDRCVFVTYQLSVAFGEACALATLFAHDEIVMQRHQLLGPRYALVYDQNNGAVRTVHHLDALPGARVPSDRFLHKAIRDCAAEDLGLTARSLGVTIRDEPGFRHRAGLRVDTQTGSLLE